MQNLLIQLKAAAEETRLRILTICAYSELTVTEPHPCPRAKPAQSFSPS